jgi:hypothetical protein
MTPDAEVSIHQHEPVLLSLKYGPRGTDHHTGGVTTVLAGKGKIEYFHAGVCPFLIGGDMPEGDLPGHEIVLILAGDHAGHATGAAGNIK